MRRFESIERSAQRPTRKSELVQKNPKEKVTKPSQTPPVKPKQQRTYVTVATAKPAQLPT